MNLISPHILQRVADFISQNWLLPSPSEPSSPLFVALSGGPDSVALLHILHTLGYECQALHCNFHLRGAESDRDQQFCEAFCASLGITLEVRQFGQQGQFCIILRPPTI